MADLQFFEPALDDLNGSLPGWWAQDDPSSELAILLAVLAGYVDELAAAIEGIYLDQSIATAGDDALRHEWAVILGAAGEQLAGETETLRAYLQEIGAQDGSPRALRDALLQLVDNTTNDAAAVGLVLDGTFPADGSATAPMSTASVATTDVTFPDDGSPLVLDGTFSTSVERLEVLEHPTDHYVEVHVRDFLAFDRAALARAVARARLADDLPSVIVETPV